MVNEKEPVNGGDLAAWQALTLIRRPEFWGTVALDFRGEPADPQDMRAFYLALADLILFVHGLIVLFNVAALPVIWVGCYRNWRFVRNLGFRVVHLAMILFIAGEAVFGAICPLTTWENLCLTKAGVGPRYQRGCLAYWVDRLLFYDLSPWIFTAAYLAFLLLVLLTFIWVKPRLPWRRHHSA